MQNVIVGSYAVNGERFYSIYISVVMLRLVIKTKASIAVSFYKGSSASLTLASVMLQRLRLKPESL